jgi:hypothetical protein
MEIARTGLYFRDKPKVNAERLVLGPLVLYFSYSTVIAFRHRLSEDRLIVSENHYKTVTTGKHLNQISVNKADRLPRKEFEEKLSKVLKMHGLVD